MEIANFPLAWRWTSVAHALFPPEILRGLRPVEPEIAKVLLSKVPKTLGPGATTYRAIDTRATQQWLRSLSITASEVTLVWDETTALTLPWTTFVNYWSDFCYPSSDDAAIILGTAQGLLLWHHDEIFEFKASAL